ncbi:MAG TPA: DUF4242 domain-containing protein, partial [Actinomycetota bacterium]
CLGVVQRNADESVTWVHSYVSRDKKRTFCIYDAPSPEAIRKTALRNGSACPRSRRTFKTVPSSSHSGVAPLTVVAQRSTTARPSP